MGGVLKVPTFLREWRQFRKMTQERLADAVDLTASSISQLENGKQGFTDTTLADLAKALSCTPTDLLAHDPRRSDSFWPLFQAAERLEGPARKQAHRVISATVGPDADESE